MSLAFKDINPYSTQSDAHNAFNAQVICLDRTHLFIKDGIEVQVSPSEYALCKLIVLGSMHQRFVPISTLELCFYGFINPASLKHLKDTVSYDESFQISDLDLFLFSHIIRLLPDRELDPTWKQHQFLLSLDDATHLQKQQLYSYILASRQEGCPEVRKRISKHVSGANTKFKERGIGIEIFSVGQSKGYMASFSTPTSAEIDIFRFR